jgi:aurora kinase/aurora kinase A
LRISIDDWIECEAINSGCSSVVKVIQNCTHTQQRALKIYDPNPGYEKLVNRELVILKQLRHPLIVSIDDMIEGEKWESDRAVMEYVRNGTLETDLCRVRTGEQPHLSDDTSIAIAVIGIVLAMRFVHSHQIIHRNLNPSHVLLDSDNRIRLTGFSHSCFDHEQQNDDMMEQIDNVRYQAPEILETGRCRSGCEYEYQVDIYSFGMILYEIVVGHPLVPAESTPLQACRMSISKPCLTFPESVRSKMRTLISACLSPNPHERPSFDKIFEQLEDLDFKISHNVDSSTVRDFVSEIVFAEAMRKGQTKERQ